MVRCPLDSLVRRKQRLRKLLTQMIRPEGVIDTRKDRRLAVLLRAEDVLLDKLYRAPSC